MSRSYRRVNDYNRLTLEDRMQVLNAYEKTRSYIKLAKQFKCSRHQIKCVILNKDKILDQYYGTLQCSENKTEYLNNNMSTQYFVLFEQVLYEWFLRAQRHVETGPITNTIFLQKAEEAKLTLGISDFETDLVWLMKFRQKHDITDVDMRMLRLTDGEQPHSLEFIDIATYILEKNATSGDGTLYDEEAAFNVYDRSSSELDNRQCPMSSERVWPAPENSENNDIEKRISQSAEETVEVFQEVEPTSSPILDDHQALCFLKPLEDYALMKENYRAIGLITQLEQIFKTVKKK